MSKQTVYLAITEAIRYLTDPEETLVVEPKLTLSMVLADAVPEILSVEVTVPENFDRNSYLTELVLRKVDAALKSTEFDVSSVFDEVDDDDHAVRLLKMLKRKFR